MTDFGAGLKFIAGSHLWRDPGGLRGATDEDLEQGWLKGKHHPVTGEPLRIVSPTVGPGSLVCVLSHGAHAVAPKAPGAATRWSVSCTNEESLMEIQSLPLKMRILPLKMIWGDQVLTLLLPQRGRPRAPATNRCAATMGEESR